MSDTQSTAPAGNSASAPQPSPELQEVLTALQQGVNVFTIIGEMYCKNLTQENAISAAVRALQALQTSAPPPNSTPDPEVSA